MDLVQVDVVHAQPGEARVDLRHDRLAQSPAPLGPGRIRPDTFVAITISSRRASSFNRRPRTTSLLPPE